MVPTASTNAQPQYAAAPAQAYPGVDATSTGSVSRHPVPKGDVSTGSVAAANQPYPGTQPYPGAAQSYPAAPQQVASAPAAAAPIRGSSLPPVASAPVAAAPVTSPRPADRPSVASSFGGGQTITIGQGDTVYALSRRYNVPVADILAANGLTGSPNLVAGRKLIIPGGSSPAVAAVTPAPANGNEPARNAPLPTPSQERVATLPKGAPEPAAVAAAKPAPTGGDGTYTVMSGDSLYTIARKLGTTTEALKAANGLKDGYLKIGQKLNVPGAAPASNTRVAAAPAATDPVVTSAVTKPEVTAYTPPQPAKPAAQPADQVVKQASLDTQGEAPSATGIGKMRWPVRGKVVNSFGQNVGGKSNDGIDISVPEGTPVKAAENGIVIYAGDGLKEFGNTVLVRHEDGTVTVYGHASKLNVTRGQQVKRGQDIALSGMSGQTDRPKLHFEVRKNSSPVDPATFLE